MIVPPDIATRADGFAGRGWVAREVADWIDAGDERFLVITGEPGSGKTALAAWLAGSGPSPESAADAAALDRVRGAWTAGHFCIARKDGTVDPRLFTESLAGQLADALKPDYLPAVARSNNINLSTVVNAPSINAPVTGAQITNLVIATESRGDNAVNVIALYNGSIRKPLRQLAESQPGLQAIVLIDALDEASRVDTPNIVSLVVGSDDLPPGVRFLLTTSAELNARETFTAARVIDLSSAESEARASEDIRAYIRSRLGPSIAAEDHLVASAAGNFLYVKFLVDEVERGDRSLESLDGLPSGLYTLYRDYLDRVAGARAGTRSGSKWERDLQPLLGCLSVATPAAPSEQLPGWLGKDPGRVSRLLDQTRQVTEPDDSPDGPGHRLYHRSMSDYLAAAEYVAKGSRTTNPYHTPPEAQHARIARHYLRNFKGADWQQCDSYGLRHVVGHLAAVVDRQRLPVERRKRSKELYGTVLDDEFQQAQQANLGGIRATLDDLRLALDAALDGEELVPMLRCVASYRRATRSGAIASAIFAALDAGDIAAARSAAGHYGPTPRPRGRWARVLNAYIAWEAALAGRSEEAVAAAEEVATPWLHATSEAEPLYRELSEALIVRAGRATQAAGGDTTVLLAPFTDRVDGLAAAVAAPPPPPLDSAGVQALGDSLESQLGLLEEKDGESDPEATSRLRFLANAETQAEHAGAMGDMLIKLAPYAEGQAAIDRALVPILTNPYPRYRDIGLVVLGTASAGVPDDGWVRGRMRSILRAGLDAEGVTFSFELPAIVLAEAVRRKVPAPALSAYLERARSAGDSGDDRWGTGVRVRSAGAAALGWQGDHDGALRELQAAAGRRPGFAGYAAVAYLLLANRSIELGAADRSFVARARERAERVLDFEFRQERIDLVERYESWLREPAPDLEAVRELVAVTPDPDTRRLFKDFASATWAAAGTPAAREWLKALVPMVLEDTTTLDAILGRVVGPRLRSMTDRELADAVDVVGTGLMSGEPWNLGQWH